MNLSSEEIDVVAAALKHYTEWLNGFKPRDTTESMLAREQFRVAWEIRDRITARHNSQDSSSEV